MSSTIILVRFRLGVIGDGSKDNQRIPVSRALLMEMSLLMNSLLSCRIGSLSLRVDESDSPDSSKKEEIAIREFSGDVLRIVVDYMTKKKE